MIFEGYDGFRLVARDTRGVERGICSTQPNTGAFSRVILGVYRMIRLTARDLRGFVRATGSTAVVVDEVLQQNFTHSFYLLLPSPLQLQKYMEKLVFIIEDDLAQQKMLQFHFEQMLGSYVVRCFAHPEDMMKYLSEKPYAVVLDHFFGDGEKTGLDYLKLMQKKYPSIPVIYYTSLNDDETRSKALDLGAESYIVKDPASLIRLRTALDSIEEKKNKKGFLGKLFGK
jgi:PleD family two-component response regulator